MSGAGPSNPEKGKGKQPAGRGGSSAGLSSSRWASQPSGGGDSSAESSSMAASRRPAGDSDAGSSRSGQGGKKRRAPSPAGTSTSGGVEEEIESQGAKRHRTGGGRTGGDNQRGLPFHTGHPGALMLQQGGDNGLLPGSGMRLGPGNDLVPANSRPGRAPQQWIQQMPNMLAAVAGRGFTSANDVSFVGKAAHEVARFSPSGMVDFVISPTYEENRLPRLDQTRAQRREGIENAVRLPFDRRGRGRGGGRFRGNGGGREPAGQQTGTRELSEEDNKKIADAVLFVFSAAEDIDMSGSNCDSCMKPTHKTGHCPEPSSKCDTAVDSFCDSTFQRNHPLDSESRSRDNGNPIGCNVLHEHFEAGRLVDLFIHLILYRIHKPPLRVRSEKYCWIRVLLKFSDVYCGGQMPAAIVENGGLLPYTKNDVASYKSELKKFDEIGVKSMPRGECDGKTIEEIKTTKRNRWLRPQVYSTYSEKHSADKLHRLSAINTDDRPTNVDAASSQAAEKEVQPGGASQGVQNPEASSSGPVENSQLRGASETGQNPKTTEPVQDFEFDITLTGPVPSEDGQNLASNEPVPELDSTMGGTQEDVLRIAANTKLPDDDDDDDDDGVDWDDLAEDGIAPQHQDRPGTELTGKTKARKDRSRKSVAVTNQPPPAPMGLHNFLMASNQVVPAGPPVSVSSVVLPSAVAQAWLQEMQRGQVQDEEMLRWTTQIQTCSTISCSWNEVAAKLTAYQTSGHMSPEFQAIMTEFGTTQR